jgi:uncharacterized membrane protein HdeD (DUF308 family)
MNPVASTAGFANSLQEHDNLRPFWIWFMALGVAMAAFGTIAISWACLATITVAATWLFGFLLLAGGITEIINSFFAGRWSGMLIHLLIGILYTMVGLMIIEQPEDSAIQLTLVIAIFLMISGIFRIVFAMSERFTGWPWVLLNGGVSLLLGLLIYKQWPASGLWVIGLFVGIELIFNGWAWIMLAIMLRKSSLAAK